MNHNVYRWIIFPLLFLCAVSCRGKAGSAAIAVAIKNQSSVELGNARAVFGKFECVWGVVVVGATKIYAAFPNAITPECELIWESQGKLHRRRVNLDKVDASEGQGTLEFSVFDDRVEVKFIRQSRPG